MKEYCKQFLARLLWKQVQRLIKRHKPVVIAVAGSVGKTGTKRAIAQVLSQQMRVQWQDGNYNDILSVPLIFFGQKMPILYNPFGWLRALLLSEMTIRQMYPYSAVVVEIGIDRPHTFAEFEPYLRADYGVLTAIGAEHMENFADIEAVAEEELQIANLADTLLIDSDSVPEKYHSRLDDPLKYGQGVTDCRYSLKDINDDHKRAVVFTLKDGRSFSIDTPIIGKQGLPALAAATLLADQMELNDEEIKKGLISIEPFAGRMQILEGQQNSVLIDDTYNASPEATKAALDTLYELKAPQKIAILGQMNELGEHSKQLHQEVGSYCDPRQLDLVVTIGEEANKYLATAAKKRGCKIMRCPSPYHAADVVRITLKEGAVVLFKGSQNGVFAEEALKELLRDSEDVNKLVRQSKSWMKIKEGQFSSKV